MSPEPDKQIAETIAAKENVAPKMDETTVISDNTLQSTSSTAITTNILQTSSASSVNTNRPSRERRQQSPSSLLIPATTLFDAIAEAPVSPSSTSSADATFEPTIDMMVNDFDDEQTLNEEEALADQEAHNPDDEIATLREESEMPIEELLAKYGALDQAAEQPPRKKAKKCKRSKKRADKEDRVADAKMAAVTSKENAQEQCNENTTAEGDNPKSDSVGDSVSTPKPGAIEAADEEEEEDELEDEDDDMHGLESNIDQPQILAESSATQEILKTPQRRSHLLDLYPEGTFDGIVPVVHGQAEIFDDLNGDDIEDAEEEEDAETDPDSFKKSVMVGPEYQAFIPEGLSQYGDMLPYENEDKLIWEPSQVSEREVEEYLLKVRDIKPSMLDEENPTNDPSTPITTTVVEPNLTVDEQPEQEKIVKPIEDKVPNGAGAETNVSEQNPVVKDNEQALHLLVQCGYDFKEALRRKRLNVLPLTSTMSLWSEDECSKFEEGIQKFGKDFLKIRQQLVRTRSMRELVQFYYLWKKSDRRDQNFANSDTVDHMDIYLNESTEYGPGNVVSGAGGSTITVNASSHRKNSAGNHKNVSIMTKNAAATQANATAAATLATSHESSSTKLTHNRRRISLQENSTKIESSSEQNVSEIK